MNDLAQEISDQAAGHFLDLADALKSLDPDALQAQIERLQRLRDLVLRLRQPAGLGSESRSLDPRPSPPVPTAGERKHRPRKPRGWWSRHCLQALTAGPMTVRQIAEASGEPYCKILYQTVAEHLHRHPELFKQGMDPGLWELRHPETERRTA